MTSLASAPGVNVEPQESAARAARAAQEAAVERPATTAEHRAVGRIPTPPEGFRRCAMRLLRDQHGMVLVYELEPSVKDTAPSILVFESPGRSARLEHYPESWKGLSNEQLLALREVH